jgi:hypothetical protein
MPAWRCDAGLFRRASIIMEFFKRNMEADIREELMRITAIPAKPIRKS